jgi:hypothetical protein
VSFKDMTIASRGLTARRHTGVARNSSAVLY